MSLTCEIHLPEKTPEEFDVVNRYLEIDIQGAEDIEAIEVPISQLVVGPFFADHMSLVKVQCWNVNVNGNHSLEPSVLEVIVKDPFHPPAPGKMELVITGKTHLADRSYQVPVNGEKQVLTQEDIRNSVTTVTTGDTVKLENGDQVRVANAATPLRATVQVT